MSASLSLSGLLAETIGALRSLDAARLRELAAATENLDRGMPSSAITPEAIARLEVLRRLLVATRRNLQSAGSAGDAPMQPDFVNETGPWRL